MTYYTPPAVLALIAALDPAVGTGAMLTDAVIANPPFSAVGAKKEGAADGN